MEETPLLSKQSLQNKNKISGGFKITYVNKNVYILTVQHYPHMYMAAY